MRSRCIICGLFLILQAFGFRPANPAYAGSQAAQHPQPAENVPPVGAPVVVNGKTLFYVPARMFTFSPEDRAKAITERVDWPSRQSAAHLNSHWQEAKRAKS